MKISNIKATITENDIMSIISEFVEIKGLIIEKIEIKELIVITGKYKKAITIPFQAKIGVGNVYDNLLNLKLLQVKVSKLGLISKIKNIMLKNIISDAHEYGVSVDKDTIELDLNIISKFIPYVYFKAKKVSIVDETVEVEIENLIYSQNKEVPVVEKKHNSLKRKISDKYSKTRCDIVENVPQKYKKIVELAMLIPDIIVLLWKLFKDKRVPMKIKIMVGAMLAYLVSPIDILPDFVPFIGKIDDIAITFFGLNAIINEVDENLILENWHGKENIILVVKEAVKYISNVVGGQNVTKLINTLKDIFSKGKDRELE